MRKIIFHLSTGFAGMDSTDNGSYPDDVTDEELDDDAWQRAIQHAESYGIYPDSDLEDISDEDMAELEEMVMPITTLIILMDGGKITILKSMMV